MSSLGAYEIRSEIGRSRGATVFRVAKAGDAGEFAAKVSSFRSQLEPELQPEEGGGGTELEPQEPQVQEQAGSFKARYLLQQQAAVGAHVVPVIDSGRSSQGEWFVTPFYIESVQSLIRRKVRLDHAQILHLVRGVVLGAQEFKQSAGRAHGNLKPSNIFISTRKRLKSDREVCVADPAAGGAKDAARIERSDLRSVGALIFSLIRRTAVDDFAYNNLPREVDAEWRERFGKQAAAWLELTRQLLNPATVLSDIDLDQLLARLREMGPGGHAVLWTGLSVAAVVVLVLLVYLVFGGLHIEVKNAAEAVARNEGKGKVTVRLNGNEVSVDGKGRLRVLWMFGGSNVVSTASGYKWSTNNFTGVGFRKRIVVTLQELTARVRVSAVAPGAGEVKVTMNGAPVAGPFPREVDVPVGKQVEFKAQHRSSTKSEVVEPLRLDDEIKTVSFNFNPGNFEVTVSGSAATRSGIVGWLRGVGVDQAIRGTNILTFTNLSTDVYTLTVSNRFSEATVLSIDLRDEVALSSGARTNVTLQPGRAKLRLAANRAEVRFEYSAFDTKTRQGTNQIASAGTYEIPAGTNVVVARLRDSGGDWPSQTNTFVAETGETVLRDFKFVGGSIALAGTTPVDSLVTLQFGGKTVTNQPARLEKVSDLRPGLYLVTVTRVNYDDWQTDVTVNSGEDVKLPAVELLEARGRIAWSVNLAGAEVELRDAAGKVLKKLSGTNGMEALDPGQYVVAATYAGLEPVKSAMLPVAKRGTNFANLKMDYWVGAFASDPSGASVKAGGRNLGVTPVKQTVLSLQERNIEFGQLTVNETNKYYATNLSLSVAVGETKLVNVKLSKIPPGPPRYTNPVGMEFVWVEGMQGGVDGGAWVGKFEVTEGEWAKVMGRASESKLPKVSIDPREVPKFMGNLRTSDAGKDYKLPAKEQWVFLLDPGVDTKPPANAVTGVAKPVEVGRSMETNRFGLFDVVGNVSESIAPNGVTYYGSSWSDPTIDLSAPNDLVGSQLTSGADYVGLRVFLFAPKSIRNDGGL